jgi:hypothetical protein
MRGNVVTNLMRSRRHRRGLRILSTCGSNGDLGGKTLGGSMEDLGPILRDPAEILDASGRGKS